MTNRKWKIENDRSNRARLAFAHKLRKCLPPMPQGCESQFLRYEASHSRVVRTRRDLIQLGSRNRFDLHFGKSCQIKRKPRELEPRCGPGRRDLIKCVRAKIDDLFDAASKVRRVGWNRSLIDHAFERSALARILDDTAPKILAACAEQP